MFTFQLTINSKIFSFNPINLDEITFSISQKTGNCIGYQKSIVGDLSTTGRQLRIDGSYSQFEKLKNDPFLIGYINVFDESNVLYHSCYFQGQDVKFNEDEETYSITTITKDLYTEYEKLGDITYNLYDEISNSYTISDTSSSGVFEQNIPKCLKLIDVLNFFVGKIFGVSSEPVVYVDDNGEVQVDQQSINVILVSSFFNNEINPITGIANDTDCIYLCQSSTVIAATSTELFDPATKFELSFDVLIKDLVAIYPDIYWYVETKIGEAGQLITYFYLESIETFRNNITTYENLVDNYSKYLVRQNEYSYKSSEIPKRTTYKTPFNTYKYFDNQYFNYQNESTLANEITMTGYTDLIGLAIDPESYSNTNFFFLKAKNNTSYPLELDYIVEDYGESLVGKLYNGDSENNIMETVNNNRLNYWKLEKGTPNTEREIVQSEFFAATVGDKIKIEGTYYIKFPNWSYYYYDIFYNNTERYYDWDNLLSAYLFYAEGAGVFTVSIINGELNELGEKEAISNIVQYEADSFTTVLQDEDNKQKKYAFRLKFSAELIVTKSTPKATITFNVSVQGLSKENGSIPGLINHRSHAIYADCDFTTLTDTQYSIINNKLAFKYTLPKYALNDQYANNAFFSGTYDIVNFSTLKKLKESKATIQVNSHDEINLNSYFIDKVGDLGIIDSATYNHLTKEYILNIKHDLNRRFSPENKIISVNFDGLISYVINDTDNSIVIESTQETDITSIIPSFVISKHAKITPESGLVQDFTEPKTYYVTSESGLVRAYRVVVYSYVLRVNVYSDNSGLPGAQIIGMNGTESMELSCRCQNATPNTRDITGTNIGYNITQLNGYSELLVKATNISKIYTLNMQLLSGGTIDLRSFTGLINIQLTASTLISTSALEVILPSLYDFASLRIRYNNFTRINFNAIKTTSAYGCIFEILFCNKTQTQIDELLEDLAFTNFQLMDIDVTNNSAPSYKILKFSFDSTMAVDYAIGDILYLEADGTGATIEILKISAGGVPTQMILRTFGSGYEIEYSQISPATDGIGTGLVLTAWSAKVYIQNILNGTCYTD